MRRKPLPRPDKAITMALDLGPVRHQAPSKDRGQGVVFSTAAAQKRGSSRVAGHAEKAIADSPKGHHAMKYKPRDRFP